MFTIPLGNFPAYTTTSRPTANTVSSGSVSNPGNAYDGSDSSYAESINNVDWYVNTFSPNPVVSNPVLYVKTYIGGASGGLGSYLTITCLVSTDAGATYPYTMFTASGDQDITQTHSLTISGSVNLANVRVKFVCTGSTTYGASMTVDVYDVRAVY